MSQAPLIQLEANGIAPVLRYDVPEPTGYEGKNFIELRFADDVFDTAVVERRACGEGSSSSGPRQDKLSSLSRQSTEQIRNEVARYLRTGASHREELPNQPISIRPGVGGMPTEPLAPGDGEPGPPRLPINDDILDGIADQVAQGYHLVEGVDAAGEPAVSTVPVPQEPDPHLYLVETLRMTTFLGDYGAGRIVKTFSLLPGEVTRISVKTFRQRESTRKSASSVLDSLTSESAQDLEKSLVSEQSDQRSFQQSKEYYADAEASAGWGWGSASLKAGVKGSTNSAREESVKNVSNATEKHSARASAKREVEVNTSFEVTDKEGEETSIQRDVENINLSRTLNFVFRQMNQEFITLIHLTDVRLAFFDGFASSRREVPLSSIDDLLDEVVQEAHEMVHIVQFRTVGGGRPPKDYVQMMQYEEAAYAESVKFTEAQKSTAFREFEKVMRASHAMFRDEIARVKALTSDRKAQNAQYKLFLEKEHVPSDPTSVMLPAHTNLADLYRKFSKCP